MVLEKELIFTEEDVERDVKDRVAQEIAKIQAQRKPVLDMLDRQIKHYS